MRFLGRVAAFMLIMSVIGSMRSRALFKDSEDNKTYGNTALSAELPQELKEKGPVMYLASVAGDKLSNLSITSKTRALNEWEQNFERVRDGLDGQIMVLDSSGKSIVVDIDEKNLQYLQLCERGKALSSATVTVDLTEEEYFDYIRSYKKRSYMAVSDMQEHAKLITECEYDLRMDYTYVNKDSIRMTFIYDTGLETNLAINMSDACGYMTALMKMASSEECPE